MKRYRISQWVSGVISIQDLLFSRAVVLKAAADTLLDSSSRRGFDQSGMLEIPEVDLPGRAPWMQHLYLAYQISTCSIWKPSRMALQARSFYWPRLAIGQLHWIGVEPGCQSTAAAHVPRTLHVALPQHTVTRPLPRWRGQLTLPWNARPRSNQAWPC